MKGNPTAGIILLLGSALLIGLGSKYSDRLKGAWNTLRGVNNSTFNNSNTIQYPEGFIGAPMPQNMTPNPTTLNR